MLLRRTARLPRSSRPRRAALPGRAARARRPLGAGLALATLAALSPAAAAGAEPAPAAGAEPAAAVGPAGSAAAGDGASGSDGTWSVEPAGQDTWRVRWRAPERLPVGSDRPTIVPAAEPAADAGVLPGAPTVAADGRTVEATVAAEEAPDPDQLDVVLSGRVLDEPDDELGDGGARAARWTAPARELLEVDPATPGPLATRSDTYRLPALRLPGMAKPVEMEGYVVEPEQREAGRPLVLLLHGRHAWCFDPRTEELGWDWPCARGQRAVPSHRGYDYLQRLLAGQGYVTVSVAANGVNAQDGELPDGGADARSRLVRAHLGHWARWVADGTRSADLRNVVLVGHSRGGMGVARAALDIPLSAAYRVSGQVLVAPTDFARQSTPYVPTVTLLPYCDGDVVDLQGQAYTDVSRDVLADDTSLKSSVLVMGANHNYFNTEWTPGLSAAPSEDDGGWGGGPCGPRSADRLTPAEQRAAGAAYVAGAVHLFAAGDERVRPLFDGSPVRVASAGEAVALSHALGGVQLRRPGAEVVPGRGGGATVRTCVGATGGSLQGWNCGRFARDPVATPHWPAVEERVPTARAFELSWSAAGQRGTLGLHRTPLDLSAAAALDLRTVVDPGRGDVALTVRVRDSGGRTADVTRTVRALPSVPEWFRGRSWAQTVRVGPADLAAAAAAGVDLSRVVAVDLLGRSGDGRIWVLDVAARPQHAPAVPGRRAPVVDLGAVQVKEGHRATGVALVPYTVRGAVTEPATVRVQGWEGVTNTRRSFDLRIPPGTRKGTFRWEYPGNRLDSLPRKVHELTAHPLSGAMPADHLGLVTVLDDDPAPQVTFRRLAASVAEGGAASWRYSLSRPVDYELVVGLTAVRGAGTPVRVNDLDPAWVRHHLWFRSGTNPFTYQAEWGYFEAIRAGRTSTLLTVPTRRDRLYERQETLTVRARTVEPTRQTFPVTVTVRQRR